MTETRFHSVQKDCPTTVEFLLLVVVVVLGIEHRTLHILNKSFPTELCVSLGLLLFGEDKVLTKLLWLVSELNL